jgi:Cu/Zn superoxide dismutase
MHTSSRRMTSTGIGLAAAMAMLVGGGGPAVADGASVTRVSGPTYLYGTENPMAGVELDIHGVQTPSGGTIVTLHASGFDLSQAGRTFGAHVHVRPCGEVASAAGPHYQNLDVSGPDVEAREVWLDFEVQADGTGHARAKRDWVFTSSAQSVIVHALATDPTGGAGPRLSCTDAVFHG